MIEPEVLATIRTGLGGALSSVDGARVIVGQPSRPLEKESAEVRVIVEDAGSPDLQTIDSSPGYRAAVEVTVQTYRDPGVAADVRMIVQRFFRGLYIRSAERHSGPWQSTAGWDIADRGRHRYAGIEFSARVYSRALILERLGVAT